VAAEKVKILVPEHFIELAVSENVIAGNTMGRCAVYIYGALLPCNAKGGVNGGLGMTVSGLLLPTQEITHTDEVVTIDGVEMVFQMTLGTEAPAEMNTWFGPRGIDSILYVLIVAHEVEGISENMAGFETVYATVMVTVLMSIVAHGITAQPLANWYSKNHNESTPEQP